MNVTWCLSCHLLCPRRQVVAGDHRHPEGEAGTVYRGLRRRRARLRVHTTRVGDDRHPLTGNLRKVWGQSIVNERRDIAGLRLARPRLGKMCHRLLSQVIIDQNVQMTCRQHL